MSANILKICCGLVYFFVAVVNAAPGSKLPKGYIRCSLSDSKRDECIRDAAQKAIPHLAKGIPSLGLVKIDPLRISSLSIDQGTGSINLKLDFNDLDILNLKTVIVDKTKFDPQSEELKLEILLPKPISLNGNYEVKGKVLVLPIVGKGKCKIDLDISKVIGNVQLKSVIKNGIAYYDILKISWKFTTKKMNIKFDNLFNGDKTLGDNMNVFLNENWSELLKELEPAIEEVFGTAFLSIGQQFFNRIPKDQVFGP